jgi:hypothetical protein
MRNLCIVMLAVGTAVFSGACAAQRGSTPPKTALAKTVYFVERDHNEHVHGLSQDKVPKDAAERVVQRVPWGRPVDVESRVDIELLDRAQLVADTVEDEPLETKALRDSIAARRKLLDFIEPMAKARERAVRAYELATLNAGDQDSDDAFEVERQSFIELEEEMDALFNLLYPDDRNAPNAVNLLRVRREMAPLYSQAFGSSAGAEKFAAAVQREIDATHRELEDFAQKLQQRRTKLRIEAFLSRGGDDVVPTALHVDGYDTIDAKRVAGSDRFGLMLTKSEREELVGLLEDAKDLAEALNRARNSGASLSEALGELQSDLARRLTEQVRDIEAIEKTLRERDELLESTKTAFENFLEAAKSKLEQAGDDALQAATNDAKGRLEALKANSAALAELLAVVEETKRVRDLWRNIRASNALEAIQASAALAERIGDAREAVRVLLQELADQLESYGKSLDKQLEDIAAAARDELKAEFDLHLAPQLERWKTLATQIGSKLQVVANLLGVAPQLQPVSLDLKAPGAVDIPIDDAQDTYVSLAGSPAKVGDTLEIRTSLIDGDEVETRSSAIFKVDRLGWHAVLAPAVVLVHADRLVGQSNDGGFSPALAWMLRRTPRPDEDDFWAKFSRWTEWGIGFHSVLLNFDPDNDTEIGLGLSGGLWRDKLIFGVGYNLMADSSDEGRIYYYVGSSLIPLLQALSAD